MEGTIVNKPVPYSTAFGMLHAGSGYLNLRFELTNKTPVPVDNCGSNIIKLCDNGELQLVTLAILEWATCNAVYTNSSESTDLSTNPSFVISLVNDQSGSKVVAIDIGVREDYVNATNDFILYGKVENVLTMLGRGRIYTAVAKPPIG